MHLNSELIFKKYATSFFKSGLKILEIGPYGNPSAYQKIINETNVEWHTLNVVNNTLDEMGNKETLNILSKDPYHYPVPDNHYDIVVSGNVMEHVEDIWNWYLELKRILKPGGYIITVMPLSWPYHEAPVDCWRIYPDGFNCLLSKVGMKKILCVSESLEFGHCYPQKNINNLQLLPGRSIFWEKSIKLVNSQLKWNHLISHIPFFRRFIIPIEVAYDTISIAQK